MLNKAYKLTGELLILGSFNLYCGYNSIFF